MVLSLRALQRIKRIAWEAHAQAVRARNDVVPEASPTGRDISAAGLSWCMPIQAGISKPCKPIKEVDSMNLTPQK
jgi:hypothetical protein